MAGLYCDFLAQQELTTANMLGVMLKQLASRGKIPNHTREAFRKAKQGFGIRGLKLPDMIDILKKTIISIPRLLIYIDALDECTPMHRREFLMSLREIVQEFPDVRVFLTGRPYIGDEIVRCFTNTLRIPLNHAYADIMSYLEMRLKRDIYPEAMNDELRADILRIIPVKAVDV